MIEARPPARDVTDIRNRRLLVIEQTRENLIELGVQKRRMLDLVSVMRKEVETARVHRAALQLEPGSASTAGRSLSRRELHVLRDVASGMPNKQIAIHLGISERTVRNHMTGVFSKLRVNNRTEAVLNAIRRGLLSV